MHQSNKRKAAPWTWPICIGLAYFGCAWIALQLTSGEDGIAAIWPASGVLVSGLILMRGKRRKWVWVSVGIASFIANLIGGSGVLAAAGYTIANLLEGALLVWVMERLITGKLSFSRPTVLAVFTLASFIASIFSAIVAGILTASFASSFLFSWFTTVLLGILSVTPAIMFIAQNPESRAKLISFAAIWVFAFAIICAGLAFGQSSYPLLFLPIIAVLFATVSLGLGGSAVAMLMVVAIGSILTASKRGIVSVVFQTIEEQVLFFQFYVVAMVLSVLPVAVLLSRHRLDLSRIEASNALLSKAERTAKIGHWRFDFEGQSMHWSQGALKMLGDTAAPPADIEGLIARHHKDDQHRIRRAFGAALAGGLPSRFTGRIETGGDAPNATPLADAASEAASETRERFLPIETRSEIEFDDEGEIAAIFGVIREVGQGEP